jgi:hypothetical protein
VPLPGPGVAAPSSNAGRAGFWCPAPWGGVRCVVGWVGGASGVTLAPSLRPGGAPTSLRPGGAPTTVCQDPAIYAPSPPALGRHSLRGHPCTAPSGRVQRLAVRVPWGPNPGVRGVGFTVSATSGRHAPMRPGGDAPGCPRRGRAHAPRVRLLRTRTCEPRGGTSRPKAGGEITPQRPRPPPPHRAAPSTTTQPVRRLRTERSYRQRGWDRAGPAGQTQPVRRGRTASLHRGQPVPYRPARRGLRRGLGISPVVQAAAAV